MEKSLIFKLKGTNGTIYLYEDKIIINRKGFIGHVFQGMRGERTIFIKDIKSIEFRKPKLYANGYIQFITNLEINPPKYFGVSEEMWKDPNIVVVRAFQKQMVNDSEKMCSLITKQIEKRKEPYGSKVDDSPSINDLKNLKELLDEGILSQEEFDQKKKQILEL